MRLYLLGLLVAFIHRFDMNASWTVACVRARSGMWRPPQEWAAIAEARHGVTTDPQHMIHKQIRL
jgi:hypothetical protein